MTGFRLPNAKIASILTVSVALNSEGVGPIEVVDTKTATTAQARGVGFRTRRPVVAATIVATFPLQKGLRRAEGVIAQKPMTRSLLGSAYVATLFAPSIIEGSKIVA